MSTVDNQVNVQLLGRTFTLRCPPEKEKDLLAAVASLNARLQTQRINAKSSDFEQVLAIAAINLAYEHRLAEAAFTNATAAVNTACLAWGDLLDEVLEGCPRLSQKNKD
jgi:cell division protein ZapA